MKQRNLLLSACGLSLATLTAPLIAVQPAGAAAEPISIGVLSIAEAAVLDDIVAEFEAPVIDGVAPTEVDLRPAECPRRPILIASLARDFAALRRRCLRRDRNPCGHRRRAADHRPSDHRDRHGRPGRSRRG